MEKLARTLMQRKGTISRMRQGVLNFPLCSMQLKTADHKYTIISSPRWTSPLRYRQLISINSQLYVDAGVTDILRTDNNYSQRAELVLSRRYDILTTPHFPNMPARFLLKRNATAIEEFWLISERTTI